MTCCFPPLPLDGRFIRRYKQGCLQFVILKPILVLVTIILYVEGKYDDGNFSPPSQSYLYLTIIYTISYSMSLYALALFYVACKDLVRPLNPVLKFIIIKSVVFLTYCQGVLVFLAAKSELIKDTEEAAKFQNFIICIEMLIAAFAHFMHSHTRNTLAQILVLLLVLLLALDTSLCSITFTMTRFTSLLLLIMIMFFIITVMLKKGVQQSSGQRLVSQRWIRLGKTST